MNYDIATEYISYSQSAIKRYLVLILEQYFDQDIYDDLINREKLYQQEREKKVLIEKELLKKILFII